MTANRRHPLRTHRAGLLAVAACGMVAAASGAASAAPCSEAFKAEALAPATDQKKQIMPTCDLTLGPKDVVTKQIVLAGRAASNLRIDCNGALIDGGPTSPNRGRDMIVIRSKGKTPEEMAQDRPQNIVVEGCRIVGSIRVIGLGNNGEAELVRTSSHALGHTERAQAAAPTAIRLSGLVIDGGGRTPLYLAPGVTRVTLEKSRLGGRSAGPGIYLDAESGHNAIIGNRIAVDTDKREQIAVDGSAGNVIKNNHFSSLDKGGIYFYRNCGEGGTVRHQAPQGNVVEDNEFFYRRYSGPNPAVALGSRMGRGGYCDLDRGFPFGSSADNLDYADHNAVIGNYIVGRVPEQVIRNAGAANRIEKNVAVPGEGGGAAVRPVPGRVLPRGWQQNGNDDASR